MTNAELFVATRDWPEEARPTGMRYLGTHGWCDIGNDDAPLQGMHALALFRDSGLRWLLDRGWQLLPGDMTCEQPCPSLWKSVMPVCVAKPDLFTAISAAITAESASRAGGKEHGA